MSINKNVRNVVIVLALAGLVVAIPGGGTGSQVALQAISLLFLGSIAWIASRLYREHRVALYSLGDQRRGFLYGAVALAVLTLSASHRLFLSPLGKVAWVLLLVIAAYALFAVYRSSREY